MKIEEFNHDELLRFINMFKSEIETEKLSPATIKRQAKELKDTVNTSKVSEQEKHTLCSTIDSISKNVYMFESKDVTIEQETMEEVESDTREVSAKEKKRLDKLMHQINKESGKRIFHNKFSGKHFKLVAGGLSLVAFTIAGFATKATSLKIIELKENMAFNQDDSNIHHMDQEVVKDIEDNAKKEGPVQENILPSYLSFDVNDNKAMIAQSISFILENRPCGVDFSTEDAIRKFVDFYLVVNLEEIDPMDYARLGYFNKTSQSIIDNYQFCMNQLKEDMYTVTPDTMIPYDLIIADKDSAEVLMHIQSLVAQYNVAESTSEKRDLEREIIAFLEDNFKLEDGRLYTRATYEIVGRMVKSIDEILHGRLPYDLTDVLSDDLYNCNAIAPTGEKNKSERAQAETSLREMLDDKLAYAREYRDQDLFNVSDIELLTGNQVEWEIYSGVQDCILDYPFVENPAFSSYVGRGTSQQTVPSVPMQTETGEEVEVSVEEIESVGVDPTGKTPEQIQAEYEAAVMQQFEQEAQTSETHTIADSNRNVVVSSDVNSTEYLQGHADGYMDGSQGLPYNPRSNSASYLAAYNPRYSEGQADKAALDNSNSSQSTTYFEPTKNQTVESQTSVSEEGYKESNTNSATPQESTPALTPTPSVEEDTTYVPVDDSTVEVEVEDEVIIEDDYIEIETHFEPVASNLLQLRAMRAVLDTIMFHIPNDEMLLADSEMYDISTKVKM